tara:strand:+ start:363 stop:548 length:186 start_codon:yes stop_codon:yes gene_type:complete
MHLFLHCYLEEEIQEVYFHYLHFQGHHLVLQHLHLTHQVFQKLCKEVDHLVHHLRHHPLLK